MLFIISAPSGTTVPFRAVGYAAVPSMSESGRIRQRCWRRLASARGDRCNISPIIPRQGRSCGVLTLFKKAFCDQWREMSAFDTASACTYVDRAVHREQFPTRGDKAVRAQSIRGRMSLIGLYVPAAAEWLPDLRAELLAFPTGKHDDMVDALGLVGQLMDKFAPGRLLLREAFEWKGDAGYSRDIDVYGPLRDSFMTL
jgi:hypothetical protein